MTKSSEWQTRFWALADERETLMMQLESLQREKEELDRTIEARSKALRQKIIELKFKIGPLDMERASLAKLLNGKTGPDPKVGARKAG